MARSPRKSQESSCVAVPKEVTINCGHCWHTNAIPVARFYDGFEGELLCESCGAPLEHAEEE